MTPQAAAASARQRALSRIFSRTFARLSMSKTLRPYVPFLSQPAISQQIRWQTTAKRSWLSPTFKKTVHDFSVLSAIGILLLIAQHAIDQESIERWHGTPEEWTLWARHDVRSAQDIAYPREPVESIKWLKAAQLLCQAILRLEDPRYDGKGLIHLLHAPPSSAPVADRVAIFHDITAKSDEWKRGYYDALMATAKASEYFDGWMYDRVLDDNFPPDVVHGPSNPRPRRIPNHRGDVPREENCEPADLPRVHDMYNKILNTIGFTAKEKMDAALEYAAFLEFKNRQEDAGAMLEKVLDYANQVQANAPLLAHSTKMPYDPNTKILRDDARPSANHLKVLTAIATLEARKGNTEYALPILISVLRARRQLPQHKRVLDYPRRKNIEKPESLMTTWEYIESYIGTPPYPGRWLSDGSEQPTRDSAERCEEAALNAYIGEIMFASGAPEDGLAWTREAVDTAEDEIYNIQELKIPPRNPTWPGRQEVDRRNYKLAAEKKCRSCLRAGLNNWQQMVGEMARMAEEEAERQREEQKKNKWSLWGGETNVEVDGRWEAEIKVVEERRSRAQRLLDVDLWRPKSWHEGILSP